MESLSPAVILLDLAANFKFICRISSDLDTPTF